MNARAGPLPRIQHEAIARLLAADLVGEQAALDSLRALREEIAGISTRLAAAESIATAIPAASTCSSTTAWRAASSRPTPTGSTR